MKQILRPRLLFHQLSWIYSASAVRFMTPLIVLPVMATRLGASEFGRLSFILIWAAFLSIAVEGGFLAAATRLAVSAGPAYRWRIAQQVFTARSVLSLLAVLGAVLAAYWSDQPRLHGQGANRWLDASTIAGLAIALGWPATWYLQATQQLNRWAKVEIMVHGIAILLTIAFVKSVVAYVLLQGAAATLLALWGWRWLYRDLKSEVECGPLWSAGQMLPGFRLGWTMMPVSIAGAAYSLALPAIGSRHISSAELGYYFLIDRVVRALLAAIDPIISLIYLRIVQLFEIDEKNALRYATRWAFIGLVLGICFFGGGELAWLVKEKYEFRWIGGMSNEQLHATFIVLGWLLPMLMGWKFVGCWILASRRYDRAYRLSIIGGAGVGLLGASIAASAEGLAWTAISAEMAVILVAIVGVWFKRRAPSNAN